MAIEVDDNSRPLDPNQNYVGISYILQMDFSDGSQKLLTSNETNQHRAYYISDYMAGRPAGWQRFEFNDASWETAQSMGVAIPGLAALINPQGEGKVPFLSALASGPKAQKTGERHLFRRKFFLGIVPNPDCPTPKTGSQNFPIKTIWSKSSPPVKKAKSPSGQKVLPMATATATLNRIEPLLARQTERRSAGVLSTATVSSEEEPTPISTPRAKPVVTIPVQNLLQPSLETFVVSPKSTSVSTIAVAPDPNMGQTIVFNASPANIYMSFADGPGVYRLEVFDKVGVHLKTFFEKKVVSEGEDWAEWDGKNETGYEEPSGEYYVVYSKNGRELKRIMLLKSMLKP